jgi:hypothetical protein
VTTYAVHQTDNGQLVSVGTIVAEPLPDGLAAVALSDVDAAALRDNTGIWSPSTLAVIPNPDYAAEQIRVANEAILRDPTTLAQRLARLAAYTTDPDVVAALARPNNQAPTTQERNRLDKVVLRRQQRQDTLIALLARLVDPALLADIGDTGEPA